MAIPNPYSGTSTLALVARASAFSLGLVYGAVKLKYLKVLKRLLDMDKSQEERKGSKSVVTQSSCSTMDEHQQEAKDKSHKKAEAKGHH